MSEREPITAELRGWLKNCCSPYNVDERGTRTEPTWKGVCDSCDAIDAVHAQLERENAELRERVAELDESADSMHDGWVRLPLDADGEPIHIGDVMENIVCPSVHREVTGVGVECFYGWDNCSGRYSQFDVNCYRHHHEPTVEDVLTEFGIDWEHESDCEDRAALLKEYATKLRLAGDAE